MAEAAGVLYGVKNVLESAALLAKGVYDPTLPLRATLKTIPQVELPEHTTACLSSKAAHISLAAGRQAMKMDNN